MFLLNLKLIGLGCMIEWISLFLVVEKFINWKRILFFNNYLMGKYILYMYVKFKRFNELICFFIGINIVWRDY